MQEKLRQKAAQRWGEGTHDDKLTAEEFNRVKEFRYPDISAKLNTKLRAGDTSPSTLREEKQINAALGKLASDGCTSQGMAKRGMDYDAMRNMAYYAHKRNATQDAAIEEGKPYSEPGVMFTSPHTAETKRYVRNHGNPHLPGMLMHLWGNGTYSLDGLPEIIYFQSKTPFDTDFKGFNREANLYKSVLTQQGLGNASGVMQSGDWIIPPSAANHMRQLHKVATMLSFSPALKPEERLHANLAMAMNQIAPYDLSQLIQRYVDKDQLRKFTQAFPKEYERKQAARSAEAVHAAFSQELEALLPSDEIGRFVHDICALSREPSTSWVSANKNHVIRTCDKLLNERSDLDPEMKKQLTSLRERAGSIDKPGIVPLARFDETFDRDFASPQNGDQHAAVAATYALVKSEMKKNDFSTDHYIAKRAEQLLQRHQSSGTLRGSDDDCNAFLQKLERYLTPSTPRQLMDGILPFVAPGDLEKLNRYLERKLAGGREALLQRQLAFIPPDAQPEELRQTIMTEAPHDKIATKKATRAHLLALKADVDSISSGEIDKLIAKKPMNTVPPSPSPSPLPTPTPYLSRSPSTLEREYSGFSLLRMARLKAIEENKSTGRIYVDAAKVGIDKSRIDLLLTKQLPLGFPSKAVYEQFKRDLHVVLKQEEIEDSTITLTGTAANFYSNNPNKPIKWHFDTPQSKESSDFDINITGSSFHKRMAAAVAYTREKTVADIPIDKKEGKRLPQRFYTSSSVVGRFPKLKEFKEKWEKELGREITTLGMSEGVNYYTQDFVLSAPFKEQGHFRISHGVAERLLRNLDGELKNALKAELGARSSTARFFQSLDPRSTMWVEKMERLLNQICPEHCLGPAASDPNFSIYQIEHKGVPRKFLLKVENGEITDTRPLQKVDVQQMGT